MVKAAKEKIFFKVGLAISYLDEVGEPVGIAKVLDNATMNRFTYEGSVEGILNKAKKCNNFEMQMDTYGIKVNVEFRQGDECGLLMTVTCDDEKALLKDHEGEFEPSLDFSAYCDRILDLCDGITIASFEGKVIT
jgi:hypothetical protein